jgi:hypothetical protein
LPWLFTVPVSAKVAILNAESGFEVKMTFLTPAAATLFRIMIS